ncbi:MAG: phosphate acyltransferase PlsX [Clostridia bacterium]|nr:phosphate acyltransferase PlsX [Clostridia bacterium]
MKIVMDGFGGDNSPTEVVKASVMAVNEIKDLNIIITGKQAEIAKLLKEYDYNGNKIEIVNAETVISCEDENPAMQIKRKPDSSLVVAFDVLKQNEDVVALISAGSTGAVLTGGFLKIGRLKGISRPALAPTLPTKFDNKGVLLLDCGANADCKPINLVHFAIMGSIYYSTVYGVEKPKVALLNVGVEDAKGKELTKEAFAMLKNAPINFVGNMEAREILSGDYDVIVADGFSGNIALKTVEGTALFVLNGLKTAIKSSFWAKFGAMFMLKSFKKLKNKLDYKQYGGSLFLGCKKNIFKAHGDSKAESFMSVIRQAVNISKNNINGKIEEVLQTLEIEEN